MHIEGLRGASPVLVPDLMHQVLAAHGLARGRYEQRQQLMLLRAQTEFDVADPGAMGALV